MPKLIDHESQLMEVWTPGSVFACANPPHAGLDANRGMVVLSVGDDGHVYGLSQATTATGWSQVDLSAGLNGVATHLAYAQSNPGEHHVAAATELGVFVRSEVSSAEATAWTALGLPAPNAKIVALSAAYARDTYAYLAAAFTNPESSAIQLACCAAGGAWTPVDSSWMSSTDIKQLDINVYRGRVGVYVLFDDATGTSSVGFVSFPNQPPGSPTGGVEKAIVAVGRGATAMASAWQQARYDGLGVDLVIARADSIIRLTPADQVQADPNAPAGTAVGSVLVPGATRLAVRNSPDGSQRFWALANGRLHFSTSPGEGAVPSDFSPLRDGVVTFGVTNTHAVGGHDLCALAQDASAQVIAHHMRQDGGTTLWNTTPIVTQATGTAVSQHAMVSRVAVRDGAASSPGSTLTLRAGSTLRASVGSTTLHIGAVPATVTADALGGVTLMQPVNGLKAPALEVTSEGATSRVLPWQHAFDYFSDPKLTVQSLLDVTTTNGQPLIPATHRDPNTLSQKLDTIRTFVAAAQKLPTRLDPPETLDMAIWDPVRHTLGDALERLEHGVAKAADAAIQLAKDGIHLVLEGVDHAVKWGEQAAATLGWLVQEGLGLAADLLADLLGGVFDWKAIGAATNGLTTIFGYGFTFLGGFGEKLQTEYDATVDWMGRQVNALDLAKWKSTSYAATPLTRDGINALFAGAKAAVKLPSKAEQWFVSPVAHAALEMVKRGFDLLPEDVKKRMEDALKSVAAAFGRVVKVIQKFGNTALKDISAFVAAAKKFLQSTMSQPPQTAAALVDTFLGWWKSVSADATNAGRKVVGLIAGIIRDVVSVVQGIGNISLRVPMLPELWRSATGRSGDPTVTELLAFGAAIPATMIMKALGHRTPFADGRVPSYAQLQECYASVPTQTVLSPAGGSAKLMEAAAESTPWYKNEDFWGDYALAMGWVSELLTALGMVTFSKAALVGFVTFIIPVLQLLVTFPVPFDAFNAPSAFNIINYICEAWLWASLGVCATIIGAVVNFLTETEWGGVLVSAFLEWCAVGEMIDTAIAALDAAGAATVISGAIMSSLGAIVEGISNIVEMAMDGTTAVDAIEAVLTFLNNAATVVTTLGEDVVNATLLGWLEGISFVVNGGRLAMSTIFYSDANLVFHFY